MIECQMALISPGVTDSLFHWLSDNWHNVLKLRT